MEMSFSATELLNRLRDTWLSLYRRDGEMPSSDYRGRRRHFHGDSLQTFLHPLYISLHHITTLQRQVPSVMRHDVCPPSDLGFAYE